MGLVDSDTMPLNVSREMLQLHEGEGGAAAAAAAAAVATGAAMSSRCLVVVWLLGAGQLDQPQRQLMFGLETGNPDSKPCRVVLQASRSSRRSWCARPST